MRKIIFALAVSAFVFGNAQTTPAKSCCTNKKECKMKDKKSCDKKDKKACATHKNCK